MLTWLESMTKEYSDLPGVRKFHYFLVVKVHTAQVVMKVREQYFGRIRTLKKMGELMGQR